MSDYPARSRGFLIGYTLVCLALGAAAVWAFLTFGPRLEEAGASPSVSFHWSDQR